MKARELAKRAFVGRNPRRTLLRAAALALACLAVFKFALIPCRIDGESMEPTYHYGSLTFIDATRYLRREPARGDVVAIKIAGRSVMLLKRIVGLPGERLAFREGALTIDGRSVPEPYLAAPCRWTKDEVRMGPGEFYVVGDNRQVPVQMHTQGRVDRKKIIGGPIF